MRHGLLLGQAAFISEGIAAGLLLFQGMDWPGLYSIFFLHMAAGCLALAAIWALQGRRDGVALAGLLIVLLLPAVGMLWLLLAMLRAGGYFMPVHDHGHVVLSSRDQDYQVFRREDEALTRVGGAREHVLGGGSAAVASGMKVILGLQRMPSRFSSPLLHHALGDKRDDIRLLAYGILDIKKKSIYRLMEKALQRYRDAATQPARYYAAAKELCELNWELVYQGLVNGEARRHVIAQAQAYAEEALKGRIYDGELRFFLGRSRLLSGDLAGAASAFEAAMALDFPPARLLPYMAELAYLRRDYGLLRATLHRSRRQHPLPVLRQANEFWG